MTVTYRPGTLEDSFAVYQVFHTAILDFGQRMNMMAITGGDDPAVLAELWPKRRSLFEHLARTAHEFWVAEDDGKVVGYARSILRDRVQELTEYFVLPGYQAGGVGRELLARAFPEVGALHRVIIATSDARAQARYLKAGVYPRFPIYNLAREPEAAIAVASDLDIEPFAASPQSLAVLRALDTQVLGHTRDADHAWLTQERQGYFYLRNEAPVGYGYIGYRSGPFALLDEADWPAVLAHFEKEAAARGVDFAVEAPMVNRCAVDYLLRRGCRLDSFFAFFMSEAPFGRFENYLCTTPPFFM
jgi:GNAT superfamily N-acetyltransferase